MSDKDSRADESFLYNGFFPEDLEGWEVNDGRRVTTRQRGGRRSRLASWGLLIRELAGRQ